MLLYLTLLYLMLDYSIVILCDVALFRYYTVRCSTVLMLYYFISRLFDNALVVIAIVPVTLVIVDQINIAVF